MRSIELTGVEGVRFLPDRPAAVGGLVLAGSSGRVDASRAELLARQGVLAESIRWFGGVGQSSGPFDVPLELFLGRVASLAREVDRVVVVGTSFGAEAALLTAVHGADVAAVAAFAPTDVVWAGVRDDGSVTSHWTLGGEPVPFVPFDGTWESDGEAPAYVGLYESSRRRFPDRVQAATIPVERIGRVLLVAGADDRVWPATTMAESIRERRAALGLATTLVTDPEAGHRTVLPGEGVVSGGVRMQRGGTEAADRRLGEAVWPHLRDLLELPAAT